jgi:hypothetical protein
MRRGVRCYHEHAVCNATGPGGYGIAAQLVTFLGLGPLAAAVAGGLLKVISVTELLVGAGLSLTTLALLCLTRPSLRAIRVQSAAT